MIPWLSATVCNTGMVRDCLLIPPPALVKQNVTRPAHHSLTHSRAEGQRVGVVRWYASRLMHCSCHALHVDVVAPWLITSVSVIYLFFSYLFLHVFSLLFLLFSHFFIIFSSFLSIFFHFFLLIFFHFFLFTFISSFLFFHLFHIFLSFLIFSHLLSSYFL